jgi:hypothetical protein
VLIGGKQPCRRQILAYRRTAQFFGILLVCTYTGIGFIRKEQFGHDLALCGGVKSPWLFRELLNSLCQAARVVEAGWIECSTFAGRAILLDRFLGPVRSPVREDQRLLE